MDNLTLQLLNELFSLPIDFINSKGQKIASSPAGNLSLLAIGYKGTFILRKIRGWQLKDGKLIIPQYPQQKSLDNEKD